MELRTGRPVLFAQHSFIFENDNIDSDTEAESEMSLESTNKTATNIFQYGECACLRHFKHLYSWERITQTIICMPSETQEKISQWNRCLTYLKSWWWNNQMRSMEWIQLTGMILHWSIYLGVGDEEVISLSHAKVYVFFFFFFQLLCYVWERWTRTHHQILSGKTSWRASKVHHNTELWTQLVVSQNSSSGMFSQDSPHCSSATKSKSSWQKWANSQKISQDGSSSCRCSTTSHGDLKTMNRNAKLTPTSFLNMQEEFHQEDGHSSDLDQERSGILLMKANHKRMRQSRRADDVKNSTKADTQSSVPRVRCLEECSKAKVVENYQHTLALMMERLKLFFAQLSLLISSVFTEQSQICVKNTKPAM